MPKFGSFGLRLVLSMGLALVLTGSVSAAGVHFQSAQTYQFSNALPSPTFMVSGTLAGLGQAGSVSVNIRVPGTESWTCSNSPGNQPPGQQTAPVTASGTASNVPVSGGKADYTVTATASPPTPTCKGGGIIASGPTFSWSSPLVWRASEGGKTVLGPFTCAFSTSTTSGTLQAPCAQ